MTKLKHSQITTTHSHSKPSSQQAPPKAQAPPSVAKPTPTPTSDVVPMEIDTSRKRIGPRVCYRCRQPGHIARDCKSTFDINAMDYASIRAHIMKELEEEKKESKESKEEKDF